MNPKFVPLNDNPEAARQFAEWSRSRSAFQATVAEKAPAANTDQWQKRYYRGLDMDDKPGVPDHQARLRLKPFVTGTPDPAFATPPVEVDPDRLATAIAALAASVRNDTGFDSALLTEAGLPAALVERIVRAARTA
jgi:anti-sigma factor RsiW